MEAASFPAFEPLCRLHLVMRYLCRYDLQALMVEDGVFGYKIDHILIFLGTSKS